MYISATNITEVSFLEVKDTARGLIIKDKSTIISFSNSSFTKIGSANVPYGAALDVIDSEVSLYNLKFEQNHAQSGAAVSVR